MTRKTFVAGNWKMNHTRADARAWCEGVEAGVDKELLGTVELGVAPPYTVLPMIAEAMENQLPVTLLAQNMHEEERGAFTGEINASMLLDVGVKMAILGHSERRHVFGESDERIAAKVATARAAGLVPLLCVGETEKQRDAGETDAIVASQVEKGLAKAEGLDARNLVVAYEPVWAIGTGRVAKPEQVDEAHRALRGVLGRVIGKEAAQGVRILYGGSVKPDNAGELAAIEDVDGFLVGGASLEASSFLSIARATLGAG